MKKLTKLSLVASLALITTQAFSADTIAKAFEEGKISGEIKSQYFQKEVGTSHDKVGIWTNGGNLSFVTGSYYGLKAGVTFQAATVTSDDLDKSPTAYNSDQNVSGAVASQAYLEYTRENTTGKVGRQYISTPLVAGSGSRIFKESFEGIVLSNTDIPNTTLVAAYVDKFQGRTDIATNGTQIKDVSDFGSNVPAVNFASINMDGAYTLYIKNTSVKNLTLSAQYAVVDVITSNDAKAFYADASYNLTPFTISAQTYQSDDGSATNSDGSAYGLNLTANFGKLSLGAAYSKVDDEADIVNGLGNGADYLYTWSWIYGGVYSADTDAYKLSAGYKITDGLSFDLMHAAWKTGNTDRKSETDYIATYNFDKNLSAKFVFADYNNISTESYRSRLYVSYKF
ncbi:MAG: OprD family outer membrane porin [Arcobacter sp.]|uniref:OprD family outer membrane porin n=1 Tax=Arcobacter sp. TaxID=1872629 RepID=UPI003AFFECAE